MASYNREKLRFLYSTREKHPTFRVDLTELFSSGLAEKGHEIDWHMQAMEPAPSSVQNINDNERVFVGAATARSNLWGKIINQFLGIKHDIAIYWLAKKKHYDFIQVRDKAFAGIIGLAAARSSGAAFFYWISYPYPEADTFKSSDKTMDISASMRLFFRLRGIFTGWMLYRIVLPRADHVFVQSDQMKKDIAARNIPLKKMTPVPMAINQKQVDAANIPQIRNSKYEDRLALVYVGTMISVRRIDFLIESVKLVQKRIPEAHLILVGDGPKKTDMQFLKEQAVRLGMEKHVTFTGFVPMEEAWAYIKLAKVCLSPFRPSPILNSTSPTKVVEYMAFGRPVVANIHPDQSKVLGESCAGYAVEYKPEAFAEAIIGILNSPQKGHSMGEAGRKYVKEHRNYEVLSQKLEKKYQTLLSTL